MSLPLPRHGNGVTVTLPELLARAEHQNLVRRSNPTRARAMLAGNRASRIKGRGMAFAEVRRYQSGDDVRTIDWRVTARTGIAHTKLFEEERERPVLFCVDLGQRMRFGSQLVLQSVQAAHLAALLGWHICAQGDRLGGLVLSDSGHTELKPRARRGGLLPLLEAIVEQHNAADGHDEHYWSQGLNRLERLSKPGTLVVVITNTAGLTAPRLEQLERVRRHGELRLFNLTDPLFEQLAQVGGVLPIRQRQSGLLGWLSKPKRQQLAAQWQQAKAEVERAATWRQLHYREISAALPLEQQWQQLWL